MSEAATTPPEATGAARLGIWLFLASETMLFVGILGGFCALRAAQPEVFQRQIADLNRPVGFAAMAVLLIAAAILAGRPTVLRRSITFVGGVVFVALLVWQYDQLLTSHLMVMREPTHGELTLFAGSGRPHGAFTTPLVTGYMIPAPRDTDFHTVTQAEVRQDSGQGGRRSFLCKQVLADMTEGPWKNTFFAAFYTFTALHLLHLLVGLVWLAFPSPSGGRELYWGFLGMIGLCTIAFYV